MMQRPFILQKATLIKRVYAKKDVSDMTLADVSKYIEDEGINYAGDYGFKVGRAVHLISSQN